MRLIAALALCAALAPGCFTLTSSEVNDRQPDFAKLQGEASKGKKVAVVALRVAKELKRDRWTRRKVAGAVEGLLLGLVPYPWDLRLTYSPGAIGTLSTFPAEAVDKDATQKLADEIEKRGMEPIIIDASKATNGQQRIAVGKLLEQAKKAGADALYVVAFNEFIELRFKHGEDKSGDSVLHEIYKLTGNIYVPSTAVFNDKGGRLLARASEYEKVFYAPMLTWGWRTDYSDDDNFDKQMEWLGAIAGTTPPQAAEKMAEYVVARDFFKGKKGDAPAEDAAKAGEGGGEDGAKDDGAKAGEKKTAALPAGGRAAAGRG